MQGLFRKVIQPRLTANETIERNHRFTGVTWTDYRNGIRYDEATTPALAHTYTTTDYRFRFRIFFSY